MPERIQLRRTKGWRKPEGAIVVSRPSRWGNWYVIRRNRIVTPGGAFAKTGPHLIVVEVDKWGNETGAQWGAWPNTADGMQGARAFAVDLYRRTLEAAYVELDGPLNRAFYLDGLAGHDLACWCPLDQPCHGDVLLELANSPEGTGFTTVEVER